MSSNVTDYLDAGFAASARSRRRSVSFHVRRELRSHLQPVLRSSGAVRLPNAENARVERSKITDYLLAFDHPEGAGKAEFFASFGFSVAQWEVLADALLIHARTHPVSSSSRTQYGTKYRMDGPICCPDGRSPTIRAVWIIDEGAESPRLVTAHPL